MFGRQCSVIGAVHVLPLPGAPGYKGNMPAIINAAVEDVRNYVAGGVDAVIIENMHDLPYMRGSVDPETTAAMAAVASAVREKCSLPIGIQILAGANLESLAVAVACDLNFLRVEGFVFAHIGDEGFHDSSAAQLMRKRAALKAENIQIFADIKKKHSAHAITSDVSIAETARAAEFFGADGVIVSGAATGLAADVDELRGVQAAVGCKVIVGSGITPENMHLYNKHCDAVIVGTSMKHDGNWRNAVDVERVKKLVSL